MEIHTLLSWSLALVPVLLLTAAFVWLDVFKLVTRSEILLLLVLGGLAAIAAYPLSGIFLDTLPIGFSNYSRFAAPWIEETLKAVVVIGLFWFNRVGLKLDGVIMGFAIGAGFSVVENIIYLVRFDTLPPSVWMVRGIGTAIMHGTTAAIMAVIALHYAARRLHREARDYHFNLLWFVPGYLVAVAIHTLFNQFPSQPVLAMLVTALVAPFTIMAILRFGTGEAKEWLAHEVEEHQALLETLDAGRYPDKPGWRRIAAMVQRADGQTGSRIREYIVVLTRLILTEEEILLRQSQDTHHVETDSRQLFARFKELRRELGPMTVHALTSLLPFSRSDYWEVWELHHHAVHGGK
jgi:RsiW-degrading membrane proteinase PrsW (M82 family)